MRLLPAFLNATDPRPSPTEQCLYYGPPDFPAASKFLPTPHHNPLRGGRKIRRPIVTSPSRLHRAHAAALGIVAAAEELLVGRSGGPQDHRRATTGACGRIGFGDGLM